MDKFDECCECEHRGKNICNDCDDGEFFEFDAEELDFEGAA